jgi:1,4-dihydroxy-6-naphthoate synthase
MYQHIDLYVNQFSVDLGSEGRRAVETLFQSATATGVIPAPAAPLFLPSAANASAGRRP